jgi:hypothetical protein
MHTDDRGERMVEIEGVIGAAGLVRRRHLPFCEGGHGKSPKRHPQLRLGGDLESAKNW